MGGRYQELAQELLLKGKRANINDDGLPPEERNWSQFNDENWGLLGCFSLLLHMICLMIPVQMWIWKRRCWRLSLCRTGSSGRSCKLESLFAGTKTKRRAVLKFQNGFHFGFLSGLRHVWLYIYIYTLIMLRWRQRHMSFLMNFVSAKFMQLPVFGCE